MVGKPGRYFLSRPRRFGKSLLVDTFKELFEGNESLFRGLAIHDSWDWSRKLPVIKIDFASGVLTSQKALEERIIHLLKENAVRLGVDMKWDTDLAVSNHGQADLTVRLADNIYVMEIKTVPAMADDAEKQADNSALAQIHAMGYADKYLGQAGVRVFELGLVFSMAKHNLVQFAGVERG